MKTAANPLKDLAEAPLGRLLARYSWPALVSMTLNALYSVVDRVYIGRFMENATTALTGVGICFPIVTIIVSFANLISASILLFKN